MAEKFFNSEADLVAKFCELALSPAKNPARAKWTAYHETAGWDLLLVSDKGVQVGIEAKLALNPKVVDQALPSRWSTYVADGPDFRAVLVPQDSCQAYMASICRHLGIAVITVSRRESGNGKPVYDFRPDLPQNFSDWTLTDWPWWAPLQRCGLPDYVPDVTGGRAAPVALTPWKIKAIKLLILLERNGAVTRADMKKLDISPTRWTEHFHGFLTADPARGGYVRNGRTPDLKAQHPRNWTEIEADFDKWSAGLSSSSFFAKGAA